jgi:hypothetical protein
MDQRPPTELGIDLNSVTGIWCYALDNVHHAAFNNTATYTSLHAPKYHLQYALSLLPSVHLSTFCSILPWMLWRTLPFALNCTLQHELSIHSHIHSWGQSQVWSWWYSMKLLAHWTWRFQVRSQEILKFTLTVLPSTPRSTNSSILQSMLSQILFIALDHTLLVCLALYSHVDSQIGKILPMSLDYTPPGMVLSARFRDLLGCRGRWKVGREWRVAGGLWWLKS